MRDIKFRGKRIDNGDWVYGDIVQWLNDNKDVSICCHPFGCCIDHEGNLMMIEAPFVCKVDPSTVGQFTGLTDKNEVEAYAEDVIENGTGRRYLLIWLNTPIHCGWHMEAINPKDNMQLYRPWDCKTQEWVVIGNIHDNPNLLESEGK